MPNNQNTLQLPMKLNNKLELQEYTIDDLFDDQKDIATYIISKVHEWITCLHNKTTANYTPLRLTIRGKAGSGKTVLINTLVTLIRKITQKIQSVHVCGPTGSAAFNAGGKTCQRLFHIPMRPKGIDMNATSLKRMIQELTDTIAIIMDERSMISAYVLGTMEQYSRQAAFHGKNTNQSWGGIPIIIAIGDDYQLPSIEEGSFFVSETDLTSNIQYAYSGTICLLKFNNVYISCWVHF